MTVPSRALTASVLKREIIMLQRVASNRGVRPLPRWLVDEYSGKMDVVAVRLWRAGISKQIFLRVRKSEIGIDSMWGRPSRWHGATPSNPRSAKEPR